MKTTSIVLLVVTILIGSCQLNRSVDPQPTGPDPEPYRIVRDSVLTGSYLDIHINEDAASVYPKIQALQASKGVDWLNVVSNIFSDLTPLRDRLPLYQYILLDQRPGSDSGVQITIKEQVVKSIYLNNGQQLTQWPQNTDRLAAVRVGDSVLSLYDKLVRIKSISQYENKFEYIFLLTKNLTAAYDAGMSQSPQWYFSYTTGQNQADQIQVHFQNGKVNKLYIDHYTK